MKIFSFNQAFPTKGMITFSMSVLFLGVCSGQVSQEEVMKNARALHHERPEGEYIPADPATRETSPAYKFFSTGFSVVQVNVDNNGNNIINDAANEPSIAFNALDPGQIAIGWRQFDNINNSFRQAGYAYSSDAGASWDFPGVIDPGVFRSDPVLGYDRNGNLFYNSLTAQDDQYWTNTYKSTDGGETWEMGTFAQGGDKQWMSIDRTSGIGEGNIYEFWNGYYSVCSPYNFTRSTDGNESYENCSTIPGDPYWGTTCVGPDGAVYMCGSYWAGGFMVAKSSNAQDPDDGVIWEQTVQVNLAGENSSTNWNSPNPGGLLGQAIIALDSTGGDFDGNLYLLCSVERNNTSDPRDVMFSRSTDGGWTWSSPVRINDDLGNNAYQWFGTMSVAPDGRIDVVWLDTRNNLGSVNSALYYSYSLDGGETWTPNEQLSEIFNPHVGWPQQNKMGDYFDMYSDEEGAHLAWAATFNNEQDVYYSVITPDYIGVDEKYGITGITLLQNYPNPFKGSTTIRYNLTDNTQVALQIFTTDGREIATLFDGYEQAGSHQVIFDAVNLRNGVYLYKLTTDKSSITKRFTLIN
ncbi:MAG: T9SS type A sorting domain-containing protein [Bacteroidales bacterium]|jgi:hypothetical protein|nr:T9SS type A sorting domain-containing protein [Bacteroidales bacterium]